MDKITEMPQTDETKARINKLFEAGLIKYDLGAKTFIWPEQEIFNGGDNKLN